MNAGFNFPGIFIFCVALSVSFSIVIYKLSAIKRSKDLNDTILFYSFILLVSNVLFVTMVRLSLQERVLVVLDFLLP